MRVTELVFEIFDTDFRALKYRVSFDSKIGGKVKIDCQ